MSWRDLVEHCNLSIENFRPNLAKRYDVAPLPDVTIVTAGREPPKVR